MSADGSTPIGPAGAAPQSITGLAAEIAARNAQLAAFTGPHGDEDRLAHEVADLIEALSQRKPKTAEEALVIAALAVGMVWNIDEDGGCMHELALRLVAQLYDWIESSSGVSAAALGLGLYVENRHDGPAFKANRHDEAVAEMLAYYKREGYLAAVRRFAPTFYPYVQRELDRTSAARVHEDLRMYR